MKTKEYIELAKRSLKIHKKSNRYAVIALSVGFALLVPIITSLFGVNVSINRQLNEKPYLLYYEASMSDYRVDTDDIVRKTDYSVYIHLSGSKHIGYLTDKSNVSNAIFYEKYAMSSDPIYKIEPMSFSVGNGDFAPAAYRKDAFYSIIDADKSDGFFPQNLTESYSGGIYLKGYDKGFDGDGKKQVVVTEAFLADNGLTPESVYQKPISIKVKGKLHLSESDPTETEGYLCRNYTVAGVIKSEITEMFAAEEFMGSQLYFTSASAYDSDGNPVLKPHYRYYGGGDYERYLVYDNFAEKDALNEEYMMLGWNYIDAVINKNNTKTFGTTNMYAECDSYSRLNAEVNRIDAYFAKNTGIASDYAAASPVYYAYRQIFDITNIASLVLLIVSVVIGFSALINMFCSISHNVRERRQYLTMMRAIGAKDKTIPRLYMTESSILCSIAGAIIAAVGFILSTAVKLIFDSVLKSRNISYNLTIDWHIIIITVIAVAAFVFLSGIAFSYICTKRLSKQKITSILNCE